MPHIWLRAEQRPFEQRVGLTPTGASSLLHKGFVVTVEESSKRVIPTSAYVEVGCRLASANDWQNAPDDVIVLGLKAPCSGGPDLRHRHIMFGHCYKGQVGASALLNRFKRGGGILYDLEYMVDPEGRRVASFGYWAGFIGAAIGLKTWLAQKKGGGVAPDSITLSVYDKKTTLLADLKSALQHTIEMTNPSVIVVGALGRAGSGAVELSQALGLAITKWDKEDTAHGGPFPEILKHDILLNCILAGPDTPTLLTIDSLSKPRRLSVVSDISCDPCVHYNPIPIYDRPTSFSEPVIRVAEGRLPLDVTAIDNLPSMLPMESSQEFADQLLPYLLTLDAIEEGVWRHTADIYSNHVRYL